MHALDMHCGALSPSPDVQEVVGELDVDKTWAPTHTRTKALKQRKVRQTVEQGPSNMPDHTDNQAS